MNKKLIATAVIAGTIFGTATLTAKASNDWAGYQNQLATQKNISVLKERLLDRSERLKHADTSARQYSDRLNDLNRQISWYQDKTNQDSLNLKNKEAECQKLNQEQTDITNKLNQANQDKASMTQQINDLNTKIIATQQNNDELSQAVTDAQKTKDLSDEAVNATK